MDVRDDFEREYASRHNQGEIDNIKTLRNQTGYDVEEGSHLGDCWHFYLLGLSRGISNDTQRSKES